MADAMDMCPTVHEQLAECRRDCDRLRSGAEVSDAIVLTLQDELRKLRAMLPQYAGTGDVAAQARAWSAAWAELERQGMLEVLPSCPDGEFLWSGTERAVHYIRHLGHAAHRWQLRAEAMEAAARRRDGVADINGRLIREVRRLATVGPYMVHLEPCVCCRQIYTGWSPVLCPKCLKPGVVDEQPATAAATG